MPLAQVIPATSTISASSGARPRGGSSSRPCPANAKLKTVTALTIAGDTLLLSAFVIRNPGREPRRGLQAPAAPQPAPARTRVCHRSRRDVYVTGRCPARLIDADYLDHLLGVVLEASDAPFNELLVLGFLTSMKKEWAWRVARGVAGQSRSLPPRARGQRERPRLCPQPLPVDPTRLAGPVRMTYTLILLRHGESDWNQKNLFTGWVDVDLTEKGGPRRREAA